MRLRVLGNALDRLRQRLFRYAMSHRAIQESVRVQRHNLRKQRQRWVTVPLARRGERYVRAGWTRVGRSTQDGGGLRYELHDGAAIRDVSLQRMPRWYF